MLCSLSQHRSGSMAFQHMAAASGYIIPRYSDRALYIVSTAESHAVAGCGAAGVSIARNALLNYISLPHTLPPTALPAYVGNAGS
eukprot:IDg10201t1